MSDAGRRSFFNFDPLVSFLPFSKGRLGGVMGLPFFKPPLTPPWQGENRTPTDSPSDEGENRSSPCLRGG